MSQRANNARLVCLLSLAMLLTSCSLFKNLRGGHSPFMDAEEKKALSEERFKEGTKLLFSDNKEALKRFSAAYELNPDFIAAYFNAGLANEALGNDEEAQKNYEQCLSHDKEQSSCLSSLLLILYKLGKENEAKALLQSYTSSYEDAPFVEVAAAKFYLAKGDLLNAEKHAREAIEREADNVEALFVMARVFFKQKRYAAAKWVSKNALEIAPSHGQLQLLLGHIYVALNLFHDALDAYQKAYTNFANEEAMQSYGLMLLRMGKVAEALKILKQLSELRPKDYRHQLHVGNVYMANKMFEEARTAYLRALELNPKDKNIDFNLGILLYDYKPKDMSEIDRLKLAEQYFKTYADQPGLNHERNEELKRYLKTLKQKIEAEQISD